MTKVRFLSPDGSLRVEGEAPAGTSLLDLAQSLGVPLEGTCEGAMACSTCHIYVSRADWGKLPPASPPEEDMLDFAAHAGPTSRLACQIRLEEGLNTLEVRLPRSYADMRGS
ncbi:MAG: 2Fe-2S iron-sulfur cluster-binding protein [Sphingomonadaceae bacterium]